MDQRLGKITSSQKYGSGNGNVYIEHQDTVFDLMDLDNNTFYMSEEDVVFLLQRWRRNHFYGLQQRGCQRQEFDSFFGYSLIYKKIQSDGVIVEIPKPGNKEDKIWEADDDNE